MVFTTYTFLFGFLPVVLLVYYGLLVCRFGTLRTLWLTLASYVFYGWERLDYLALILASTALDYLCGRIVADQKHPHRRWALLVSLTGNLGLLAYFKYSNFGMETVNALLDGLGQSPLRYAKVALPVGISFYTFQTMSYTLDVYRGQARQARSFLDLACFVVLFPQLVAGPIVRYRDMADQLVQRRHSLAGVGRGALLFMCGFAKKILIADSAGRLADAGWEVASPGFGPAWITVVAYAVQIYFDFSGYSDMAIGLGNMLGFRFPLNFASPYRSRSITEFWRRWHISLSTWLRDYLYIPLGGSQGGAWRTYRNLMLTMLLGGLWHGAQWTFVAWGAFHGGLLAFERLLGKRAPWSFLPGAFQTVLTFVLVLVGWVFFRSPDMANAFARLAGMAGGSGAVRGWQAVASSEPLDQVLASVGLVLLWTGVQSDRMVDTERPWWSLAGALWITFTFLLAVGHMFFQSHSPFLYFQF